MTAGTMEVREFSNQLLKTMRFIETNIIQFLAGMKCTAPHLFCETLLSMTSLWTSWEMFSWKNSSCLPPASQNRYYGYEHYHPHPHPHLHPHPRPLVTVNPFHGYRPLRRLLLRLLWTPHHHHRPLGEATGVRESEMIRVSMML